MKITRWARKALVMILDWYGLRLDLEYVRQDVSPAMAGRSAILAAFSHW